MKPYKSHMTKEWLRSRLEAETDEPIGCEHCGAIAGACASYPNCPGASIARPPRFFIGHGDLVATFTSLHNWMETPTAEWLRINGGARQNAILEALCFRDEWVPSGHEKTP